MAMPLLAVSDPVNKKPIKVIDRRPPICQVMDLMISLIVVSMRNSLRDMLVPSVFRIFMNGHSVNLLRNIQFGDL